MSESMSDRVARWRKESEHATALIAAREAVIAAAREWWSSQEAGMGSEVARAETLLAIAITKLDTLEATNVGE